MVQLLRILKILFYGKMMGNNILIVYSQVFGELVLFGQSGQVTVFIGGEHPFLNGMEIAQTLDHFFDELLVLHQVLAP